MYYFFVNPTAHSGAGALLWQEAEQILKAKHVDYEVHFTKKETSIKDDYEDILKRTTERPIKLVILGGDGTLNLSVQGITDLENTELSLIRCGSGNDFCRNKNFPDDLEEAIDGILTRKHELMVDVGEVKYSDGIMPDGTSCADGSHRFMVSCGLGYDADVCYNANHNTKLKKLLGHNIYTFYGVKNIFTTGLANLEISLNGEISYYPHVYFLAAMNQPCEGGGLPMIPDASDTDGVLDFCMFYGLSRMEALLTIPKLMAGNHIGKKGVAKLRGQSIKLTCSEPKMVHYDGEVPGMYKCFEAAIAGKIKFIY